MVSALDEEPFTFTKNIFSYTLVNWVGNKSAIVYRDSRQETFVIIILVYFKEALCRFLLWDKVKCKFMAGPDLNLV